VPEDLRNRYLAEIELHRPSKAGGRASS
jgi:hypothetical protein